MESITLQPTRFHTTPDFREVNPMFRAEERVFRLLTTYLIPETLEEINNSYDIDTLYNEHLDTFKCKEWLEQEGYLENELRTNEILCKFFDTDAMATADLPSLLAPLKAYYLENEKYKVYADVFSYDIQTLESLRNGWEPTKQPIVLWMRSPFSARWNTEKDGAQESTYLGHIYYYINCGIDNYIEHIGIRESLRCTLEKLYHNNPNYKNIAFSILDACAEHGKKCKVERITLACPIGGMVAISERYGFVDDELTLVYS